jgi:hypothetical protein
MEKIALTTELVNGILQYLGSKPFVEVANLINEIHKQAGEQGAVPMEAPKDVTPVEAPTTTQ